MAGRPAAAEVEVSIPEARAIAVALEAEGRQQDAAAIAAALLQRDPDDAVAWILVARIRRAAGDVEGALDAARRANAAAATDDERFAAAMELAAGNFLREQGLIAQFWLRRAAQVAPTDELRAAAIRDFRSVRARTPWSYSLSFSVVPSSNVNNGSRADIVEIAGLPFVLSGDAQALSGVEIAVSGSARLRFAGLGGQPAQAYAGFAVQQVVLSDEARRQAPEARGADYAFEAIEVGLSQVVSSWSDDVVLRFDTLAGRNRYGGAPLSDYLRGGLMAQWAPGQQSLATLAASVERQKRLDDPDRSAWVSRVDLRRIWQAGNGDVFGLGGGVRLVQSDSIEIDNDAVLVEVDYTFAEPVIGPTTLGVGLNVERRLYDASPFTTDGRQDTRLGIWATLGAPAWNFYGFGPTMTIEASRTLSNISLYEAEDIGIRLGITSVF
ncbi:hypothetical protein ACRDNQ_12590 [Palleronia sp. KMU-117]|uniref:hypothetical protein n=1 Tax=Palleronia sp. KMU-117 TaxID=3434108 RepID=UPI003D712B5B